MRRAGILICMLFFFTRQSDAQLDAKPAVESLALLQHTITDTDRVQVLLQLVLYYYFDHTEVQPDLNKMFFYLQQAQQANKGIHATKWQNELNCYFGKYFLLIGDEKKASDYFEKIAYDIEHSGDLLVRYRNWHELAINIREIDSIGLTRNACFLKIMALYSKAGNTEKVLEMERAVADTHLKQGNLDAAEAELLAVLEKYKAIGSKQLLYTYNLLSSVYSFKGNYNTALHYALLTIESMRNTLDTTGIVNFYCRLAYMYDELGQEEKSAESFRLAFNRPFTNPIPFYNIRDAGNYTRVLIKQHKPAEALSFITDFATRYPPVDSYGKASLARTLAWYYRCKGDLAKYEKYTLEMIALAPLMLKNNEITEEVANDLGRYFLDKKEFAAAAGYFNQALTEASYVNCVYRKKDVYLMLFKTDSSMGHYVQAIQHLNQYRRLNDSIFTVVKNQQVQEVQVQYETKKKDRNIQLLTQQNQLQLANLHAEKKITNMVLVCTGMLIVLLGLGYNRYKLKQKNNRQLQEQQKNIQEKNNYLQRLLQEKEWLVKEIHHRVKNNFHTVMGLLGTQSGYLRNKEAITAMAESQQRIQAMSLIHQKLYQSENMSDIDIKDYIHELVDYLKDSLNTGRRIQFHFQAERIHLGVYHAVPIGLILNETITNAIKYAFPGNRNGNIYISFTADTNNENTLLLVVKDDGTGLPEAFDNSNSNTMGMNLMKGLARDIDGQFSIYSAGGTTVTIAFLHHRDMLTDHTIIIKATGQTV